MNALLAALTVVLAAAVALAIPGGAAALVFCAPLALVAGLLLSNGAGEQRPFLMKVFVAGLLLRMAVGVIINGFELQEFFGGDALTYDWLGGHLVEAWRGDLPMMPEMKQWALAGGWGMVYLVAAIYGVVGRNMLAVQFFNAVVGAATAPVIYLCALHIFQNTRVAKVAALFVAFFPSLVLWSSQGLKDGPIVFLLALSMLATLKLGERLSAKYVSVLVLALYGLLCFRFYIFYMTAAAVCGAFVIGMRPQTTRNLLRQFLIVLALGLGLTYMGVLRSANTGFGEDVDVSTASGALSAVPLGVTYLLFAPFPWQLASLRQSITLPEMIVWWAAFPLLVLGIWFTLKYRLRQALPILLFTTMLTLAYSIFQGNVGTAYRQRSQILVFYFIFVAVGAVLLKERQEERQRQAVARKQSRVEAAREVGGHRRYERWDAERGQELEQVAQDIAGRINF